MENNNNNAPKMDAPKQEPVKNTQPAPKAPKQEPVKNTQPAPKAPKQTKPKLVSTNKLSFKPESSDDLRTQIDFGDYDDKVDPFQSDEEFKQEWIKNRASNKFKYNPNKIMNKMGLSDNDLEPEDKPKGYLKDGNYGESNLKAFIDEHVKQEVGKGKSLDEIQKNAKADLGGESPTFDVNEEIKNAYNRHNSQEPNDEEKEYDNIDDDYERSYGPVTNDKEYQAYLKWKENGDSFDNIGDKIRNQMGISEEEWNEPYNDGMVNIDKGKPRISNANLTTAFVDGKISGKEYYKEVNDRIKENNRKMQLMTSQVPYNGLDAKSKEEYDRIKEQNDEWNFIIDEYDLDNKYADSKVLNQMGLGNEDDIEDKAMEIVSNEGRNAFKSFLNGQLTDEQYEKNVKDKLMSELGVDEQQAQDLWNKYGGYLGGGLNPMNEEQKAAALNQMGLDEEEEINDKIGGRGFEMDDGRYLNVELKNGKLYAGSATNSGIMQEYSIDYDSDVSLDQNLQNLYDKITEEDLNNN